MWVDVRIQKAQARYIPMLLNEALLPMQIKVNVDPPASGPEIEISMTGVTEKQVRDVLERRGVTVLAIRRRPEFHEQSRGLWQVYSSPWKLPSPGEQIAAMLKRWREAT